jgi:hypothetical protein
MKYLILASLIVLAGCATVSPKLHYVSEKCVYGADIAEGTKADLCAQTFSPQGGWDYIVAVPQEGNVVVVMGKINKTAVVRKKVGGDIIK